MAENTYEKGDDVRLTGTFKDISLVVQDPDTVTLKIYKPDGSVTTLVYGTDVSIIRVSTGVYRYEFTVTQSGEHQYKWIGTGLVQRGLTGTFAVRYTPF